MFSFVPKLIYDSVCDLTPQTLKSHGISMLLMDFENTIVPYTCDIPQDRVLTWMNSVKDAGITLCVVSNTKRGRAVEFCRKQGIACITHAKKPFPKGIRQAMRNYCDTQGKIALVGDQIYTDVLGANYAGVISILVTPIHLHNVFLKLRHVLELPWIAIGRKKHAPS